MKWNESCVFTAALKTENWLISRNQIYIQIHNVIILNVCLCASVAFMYLHSHVYEAAATAARVYELMRILWLYSTFTCVDWQKWMERTSKFSQSQLSWINSRQPTNSKSSFNSWCLYDMFELAQSKSHSWNRLLVDLYWKFSRNAYTLADGGPIHCHRFSTRANCCFRWNYITFRLMCFFPLSSYGAYLMSGVEKEQLNSNQINHNRTESFNDISIMLVTMNSVMCCMLHSNREKPCETQSLAAQNAI